MSFINCISASSLQEIICVIPFILLKSPPERIDSGRYDLYIRSILRFNS